jgi:hypothetical protein
MICFSLNFLVVVIILYLNIFNVSSSLSSNKECEKMKSFFNSTSDINRMRIEWQRLMPMFIKKDLERLTQPTAPNAEIIQEYHKHLKADRFNVLGPIGPACNKGIEGYGHGDEEKRACGLSKLSQIADSTSINNGGDGSASSCVVFSIGILLTLTS